MPALSPPQVPSASLPSKEAGPMFEDEQARMATFAALSESATRQNPVVTEVRTGLCICWDSPSWDRTRTLLLQRQTCCQLHQGAAKNRLSLCSTGGTRVKSVSYTHLRAHETRHDLVC